MPSRYWIFFYVCRRVILDRKFCTSLSHEKPPNTRRLLKATDFQKTRWFSWKFVALVREKLFTKVETHQRTWILSASTRMLSNKLTASSTFWINFVRIYLIIEKFNHVLNCGAPKTFLRSAVLKFRSGCLASYPAPCKIYLPRCQIQLPLIS